MAFFTFNVKWNRENYLSQGHGKDAAAAFSRWIKRSPYKKALPEHWWAELVGNIQGSSPVNVTGLTNVWTLCGTMNYDLAVVTIIKTDKD